MFSLFNVLETLDNEANDVRRTLHSLLLKPAITRPEEMLARRLIDELNRLQMLRMNTKATQAVATWSHGGSC